MSDTEATNWLDALIQLRVQAGNPSTRRIAALTASLSHSTVGDIFRGARFPPLPTLLEIVRALGGDESKFIQLWRAAYNKARAGMGLADPPLPPSMLPDTREVLIAILAQLRRQTELLQQLLGSGADVRDEVQAQPAEEPEGHHVQEPAQSRVP